MEKDQYLILAYYCFTKLEDPELEVKKHYAFFEGRDAKARVYISEQGINGQMSAAKADAESYMEWLKADSRFSNVEFKIHFYHEHVYPRLTFRTREQLVAIDEEVDLSLTGEHLAPEAWEKMLDERDENTLLLDVRNDYEWEIGHFEGAELPDLEKFREFPTYARKLKEQKDPKETKIMMYCTGGIRCELFSALLKKEGFENVYQLHGGVIKYGLENGEKKWKGKLFVFDDRMAVPISEEGTAEVISKCFKCGIPADTYYNCASMDCNELFICCPDCAEENKGCCSQTCMENPRIRPFVKEERPKPFRRKHLLNN